MDATTAGELTSPLDNSFDANMERPGTTVTKQLWIDTKSLRAPNVLDPDDTLMKKFQNALREHLVRVDNRLNNEILELVSMCIFFIFKAFIKYIF